MDFREFSEAYNNYLMHARSGRESNWYKQAQKHTNKSGNFLAQYVTDPFWKKEIVGGYIDSEIYDACMRIAQNKQYTDSQKRAMIENKLRPWFSQMGHNNFGEFSEAYNNYLMHAGIDKGELLRQIATAIKAARKSVPADKQQQYDQASNQLNQAINDNDRQQAIQAITIIKRYGTLVGRNNRFWDYVIDNISKKEEIRVNPEARDFHQGRPKRI